jgi:hypothetical protein
MEHRGLPLTQDHPPYLKQDARLEDHSFGAAGLVFDLKTEK